MKLSSRLQSRLAKRRTAIRHFEEERAFGKLAVSMGRTLLSVGLIGEAELDLAHEKYRHVRTVVKDMAEDQSLDKALLRLTYDVENTSVAIEDALLIV